MILAVLYMGTGVCWPQVPTVPMPATATAAPPEPGQGSCAGAVLGGDGGSGRPATAATGRKYCRSPAATSTTRNTARTIAFRTL